MTEFPKIKRFAPFKHYDGVRPCLCDLYNEWVETERASRSEWAKALLKELSFFQPSGVTLEVLNIHLARVKAELLAVAEEDGK